MSAQNKKSAVRVGGEVSKHDCSHVRNVVCSVRIVYLLEALREIVRNGRLVFSLVEFYFSTMCHQNKSPHKTNVEKMDTSKQMLIIRDPTF